MRRDPNDGPRRERDVRKANEPAGDRTRDLRIKSPLLYQLSYRLVNQVGER